MLTYYIPTLLSLRHFSQPLVFRRIHMLKVLHRIISQINADISTPVESDADHFRPHLESTSGLTQPLLAVRVVHDVDLLPLGQAEVGLGAVGEAGGRAEAPAGRGTHIEFLICLGEIEKR